MNSPISVLARLRGAQRLLGMHRVGVPATLPLAAQVALVDQLGDDPLGGSLGDVERRSDVPQPHGRILRDHHHHPCMVGDECPCTHDDFLSLICPVCDLHYPDLTSVIQAPFPMDGASDRVPGRRPATRAASYTWIFWNIRAKQLFARAGVAVPEGEPADDVDDRRRRGRADRLPVRDQGPGPDRRPRQGRWASRSPRTRTRPAPMPARSSAWTSVGPHGEGPFTGPSGLGRGGVGDRRRVLRLDHPRPLGEDAARDPLADGRDERRGDRRERSRRARPPPRRPAGRADPRRRRRARRRRRDRRGRRRGRRREPRPALRGLQRLRRDPDRGQPADRHLGRARSSRSTPRSRSTARPSSATRSSPTIEDPPDATRRSGWPRSGA